MLYRFNEKLENIIINLTYIDMKKTFFLFTACIYAMASFAQSYKPVLSEGKSWKYATVAYDDSGKSYTTGYYDIVLKGDTTVNERVCKKISIRNENGEIPPQTIAAYEDNGKVYLAKDETFVLQFDMGLKNGDVFDDVERVIKEDEIVVNGTSRKRLLVDTGIDTSSDYSSYTLVEGIGKDKLIRSFEWGTECRYAYMVACYENGVKIFDESDFNKSDTGLSQLSYVKVNSKEPIFNLAGQQVGKVYKGIMIQNGKKFCK